MHHDGFRTGWPELTERLFFTQVEGFWFVDYFGEEEAYLTELFQLLACPELAETLRWLSLRSPDVQAGGEIAELFLCAVEAKRDDFVQGRAQCIAEMMACRWNNLRDGHGREIYGIVSNGQTWQFYKLDEESTIAQSSPYTTSDLPSLLGALDHVCALCAKDLER